MLAVVRAIAKSAFELPEPLARDKEDAGVKYERAYSVFQPVY